MLVRPPQWSVVIEMSTVEVGVGVASGDGEAVPSLSLACISFTQAECVRTGQDRTTMASTDLNEATTCWQAQQTEDNASA